MPKKELKTASCLENGRPQRAAKAAAIMGLKNSCTPLNVKMRNLNNAVWKNVTIVKEEVETAVKEVKRLEKVKVEKPVAVVPKEERGDKENKPEKHPKAKKIEKNRPIVRSASVAKEPLAGKRTAKSRTASQS